MQRSWSSVFAAALFSSRSVTIAIAVCARFESSELGLIRRHPLSKQPGTSDHHLPPALAHTSSATSNCCPAPWGKRHLRAMARNKPPSTGRTPFSCSHDTGSCLPEYMHMNERVMCARLRAARHTPQKRCGPVGGQNHVCRWGALVTCPDLDRCTDPRCSTF